MGRRISPWVILDVVLYVACLSVAIVLGRSIIAPQPGHVSCTDLNLQHVYDSDTISLALVLVSCAVLPAPVILLTEILVLNTCPKDQTFVTFPSTKRSLSHLKEAMFNTASLFWDLLVGMGMAYLLVEILKVGTAYPRPNFWDMCGNDTHSQLCGNSNDVAEANVELELCSNPHQLSWSHLADAAKSFPSGHSCFSAFIALFMTAYYHHRFLLSQDWPPLSDDQFAFTPSTAPLFYGWSTVARRWLPLPWIAWATVVSASRIWDHKHHWHDVLGGVFLGVIMSMYTIVVVTDNFRAVVTVVTKECKQKRGALELNSNIGHRGQNDFSGLF
ncbi:Phosphatidic acid phosphatase type 2/haloperoxidase [Trinorchestia longiramus]|nr:Phosphatidic acid phosphatase type 2/haloperoxidase [Trinorchestia longiramus]